MAYVKQNWQNLPNQTTPLSAQRLNHLETQYDEALKDANAYTDAHVDNAVEQVIDNVRPAKTVDASPLTNPLRNSVAWDKQLSIYNPGSQHLREARTAINAARIRGEKCAIHALGMSLVEGVGAPPWGVNNMYKQFIDIIGGRSGVVLLSERGGLVEFSGGITQSANIRHNWGGITTDPFTITYESVEPFTEFNLYAYRQQFADLEVMIDGVPADTFTVAGGSSWKVKNYNGLPNTTHTVVISGSEAGFFVPMIEHVHESGVTLGNFGRGSSSASDWLPAGTTSDWSQLYKMSLALDTQNEALPVPDVVLIMTGLNGSTPEDIETFITNVVTNRPGTPVVLIGYGGVSYPLNISNSGQRNAMLDMCDTYNLAFIDMYDVIGNYAEASGRGLMADTVHGNALGNGVQAAALAKALTM